MVITGRIFLAHASEDKPQIRQLYGQLKERGFSPWLDDIDLIPGQKLARRNPKGHRELCCMLNLLVQAVGETLNER